MGTVRDPFRDEQGALFASVFRTMIEVRVVDVEALIVGKTFETGLGANADERISPASRSFAWSVG